MTKEILIVLGLASSAVPVYLPARTKRDCHDLSQAATVISVNRQGSPSHYPGGNPSDAPLVAKGYRYDIGIRLGCNIYVGRYESAIDYLPSAFAL